MEKTKVDVSPFDAHTKKKKKNAVNKLFIPLDSTTVASISFHLHLVVVLHIKWRREERVVRR
jgi:hypothetical protein